MTLRNQKTKTQCRSHWRANFYTHLEPQTPGTTLLLEALSKHCGVPQTLGPRPAVRLVQNKLRHHNVHCVSVYVYLLTLTFPFVPFSCPYPSSPSSCCPGPIPLILTYLMKCLKPLSGNPSIPITRTHSAQVHIKRQGLYLSIL